MPHGKLHTEIGKSPIRRLLSRGNTSPFTTFDSFFPLRSARHTPPPTCGLRRIRVFFAWCRLCGRRTIHPSGSRPLDVSLLRQTSAPGTSRAPENPRFPAVSNRVPLTDAMAPSRVHVSTGLTAEASPDSTIRWQALCHGLRPGRIRRVVVNQLFLPASSLNPTAGQTSAKSFRGLKGHEVSHDVIARP